VTIRQGVINMHQLLARFLRAGSTVSSDRNKKANLGAVDPREVLAKVASLEITTWNYISQGPTVRHIGPMAQDFHATFGVGDDPTHINVVDAIGVALAAIQGLHQIVQEQDARVAALEARLAALESHDLQRV
jgi:trimeric autotransporter adhesin